MNKRIFKLFIFICCIILIVIPLIIHIAYKSIPSFEFIKSEWGAGDILSYYGVAISGIMTLYLGIISYYQNQWMKGIASKSNTISMDLLEIEKLNKKAYANFLTRKCKIANEGDKLLLHIELRNSSKNDIISADFSENVYFYVDDRWNEIIDKSDGMRTIYYKDKVYAKIIDGAYVSADLELFQTEQPYIFSFKVKFVSIFGYTTQQLFYLQIEGKNIIETLTVIEDYIKNE